MRERREKFQNEHGFTVFKTAQKYVFSANSTSSYFGFARLSALREWALRRFRAKGRRWDFKQDTGAQPREDAPHGRADPCGGAEKLG